MVSPKYHLEQPPETKPEVASGNILQTKSSKLTFECYLQILWCVYSKLSQLALCPKLTGSNIFWACLETKGRRFQQGLGAQEEKLTNTIFLTIGQDSSPVPGTCHPHGFLRACDLLKLYVQSIFP